VTTVVNVGAHSVVADVGLSRAFSNLRWRCPFHGGRSVICGTDGGSVATVVDIGDYSVVFDVGLGHACSPWLIATTIAFLLDYKWVWGVTLYSNFFLLVYTIFF